MKNKILTIIAAAVCLASCDLNYSPLSKLSPETFFSNESELQAFSNQFYTALPDTPYEESSDLHVKNSLSDEMRSKRTVPSSGGGWDFSALRNYNTLIEYSVNCPDEKVRTNYVALARFFRANFYFDKVKRFGDYPWYDKQLGSEDAELYKPRDSRELIMTKIIEDLDFAAANLTDKKDLYRVTKWTALALKSRACLFEGTFRKYHAGTNVLETLPADAKPYTYYLEQAAAAAEEIMNTSGYTIFKGNGKNVAYRDLFLGSADTGDAYGDEIILARDYNATLMILHNSTYYTIGNYGNPSMTRKMACSYLMADGSRYTEKSGWETKEFKDELKGRDPRMSQSIRGLDYKRVDGTDIQAPSFVNTITGYQPTKYMLGLNAAADTYNKSYQDLHIYRYAEILLNYAEAKAELGGAVDQAVIDKSIKLLRDRVGMPNLNVQDANANPCAYMADLYPNVTGENKGLILEIRRERMVELFDENMRYPDVLRWRNGSTFKKPIYGIYIPGPGIYDLNGDGKNDVHFYTEGQDPTKEAGVVARKIGGDTFFSEGDHGYVIHPLSSEGNWDEEKDYLYPLPILEMQLNESLTQNPKWE